MDKYFVPERPEHISDSKRVKHCLEKELDIDVNLQTAEKAWQAYSDSMCAGWMQLPRDDYDVAKRAKIYLEENY